MKKTGIILIAALLALLLLGAKEWPDRNHGPFPLAKFMNTEVKKLNLTQAQLTQYDSIKAAMKQDTEDMIAKRKEVRSDVESTFASANPDINALSARLKQDLTQVPDMLSKRIDYFMEFYNILTPDQQKVLIADINQKLKSFPEKRDERSKHPSYHEQE